MTELAPRAATPWPSRLEVVDGAGAELDRETDRAELGELVAVQPELEAGRAARLEVATGLLEVEGAALEEDVRGLRRGPLCPA